ncbi:MAG: hypothetical protein CMP23_09275 [Rickettsiales bacterium]|nr:hypothetical protein [Rickettsiales bacterium]|tara:strand:- start:2517 stop:3242 length:726 start_codon:yes stop_codon:yes gene_type:complete
MRLVPAAMMLTLCGALLLAPSQASALEPDFPGSEVPALGLVAPALELRADLFSVSDLGSLVPIRQRAAAVQDPTELSMEERRKIQARLKLRRKMVPVHQALAFIAAGSIVAAEVVGVINDRAINTGTPTRDKIEDSLALHRVLAGVGTAAYLGAGVVAWTMPPGLATRKAENSKGKFDSGKVHRILSIVHGIAMGTVIATGILQANVAAGEDWEPIVAAHKISGFTAAGAIIAAGIVITAL